jgi:hypothetical protein
LSKSFLFLVIGSIFFSACRKENFQPLPEAGPQCQLQTENPAGRSYNSSSVISYTCTQKLCGFIPLNSKNYWVYEDSIFTDGVFSSIKLDTLQFISLAKTLEDGLVWWESNKTVGLPDILYASDSSFFELNDRMYNPSIKDVKKDFGLFTGDSIRYLTSFDDNAAMGRSVRLEGEVQTPAGSFSQCIFFEKDARNYRRDQVIYRPGLGVIKYRREKARVGTRDVKLEVVSTLVAYHVE